MWEQPKECVCSVPATLIQQNFLRSHPSSRLLPECISQPLIPGMPTQVELEVAFQSSALEQGLPSEGDRESRQTQRAANRQAPACRLGTCIWGPALSLPFTQSVLGRVGIAAPVRRQSHQQSSLPSSAHTLCRLTVVQRPSAKRTKWSQGTETKHPFQRGQCCEAWDEGLVASGRVACTRGFGSRFLVGAHLKRKGSSTA